MNTFFSFLNMDSIQDIFAIKKGIPLLPVLLSEGDSVAAGLDACGTAVHVFP
jgi:hypothetical protein